jgi:septum formation protein
MTGRLVLASVSATRRDLLVRAGIAAESVAAGIDETTAMALALTEGRAAAALATDLAEQKARTVAARCGNALVIGADQVLEVDGRWLSKPTDRADAKGQLTLLRGRSHALHTAVCLVREAAVLWRHLNTSRLTMRILSDAAIERYLDDALPAALGSVGAYQLEGLGAQLFSHVDGNFFAILGLPLLPLLEALRQHGAAPP